MKKIILQLLSLIVFTSCNSNPQKNEVSWEEKKEMEKVETFKKTDKQKEDSVLAKWQKKMDESKVGEDNNK